jgi:hypothetical protein
MYFFVFLAHPKPSHPEYGAIDGAYVSCWVRDPVEGAAEAAARELIEATGWDVEERDEAYPLADDHYATDQEAYEHMEQARLDGICAVFHRWDVGAPDE